MARAVTAIVMGNEAWQNGQAQGTLAGEPGTSRCGPSQPLDMTVVVRMWPL